MRLPLWQVLIVLLLSPTIQADPWYYQTDESVMFWVPDKAQHFYGSQILVEVGLSPLFVLSSGLLYELSQDEFSVKDLLANVLGVLAAQHQIPLVIDYSVVDKEIVLRVVVLSY